MSVSLLTILLSIFQMGIPDGRIHCTFKILNGMILIPNFVLRILHDLFLSFVLVLSSFIGFNYFQYFDSMERLSILETYPP